MKNIRKVLSICNAQIIFEIFNLKNIVVLISIFFFMRSTLEPVRNMVETIGVKIHPYVFPILMNDMIFPIVIIIGYIAIVCDAPFIREGYLFTVFRSGKKCWLIGQMLYLFCSSVLYIVLIVIFSIVNLLPFIEFGSGWGKVILTITRTDAAEQFEIVTWNEVVVNNYTVVEAVIKTIFLMVILLWVLGLIIFLFNYLFHNSSGVMVAMLLGFLDLSIYNFFPSQLYRYSPVSLMKLSVITGVESWSPTFEYAVISLIGLSFLLILLITILGRVNNVMAIERRK